MEMSEKIEVRPMLVRSSLLRVRLLEIVELRPIRVERSFRRTLVIELNNPRVVDNVRLRVISLAREAARPITAMISMIPSVIVEIVDFNPN